MPAATVAEYENDNLAPGQTCHLLPRRVALYLYLSSFAKILGSIFVHIYSFGQSVDYMSTTSC